MKEIKTDLATVTYSNTTSAGTALVKELKDYVRKYDNMLIHSSNVDALVKDIRAYADTLLEAHKQWKDVKVCATEFNYPGCTFRYTIFAGEDILHITPAKAFLAV